jgi:hypothetical protein
MTARLEIGACVGVVVNLAVERHPDAAVLVRHRLLARGQVDDAQPAMGEGGRRVAVKAGLVRSAMREAIAHAQRTRWRVPVEPVNRDNPGDSTHAQPPSI